jgi:hypothetical protein
MSKKYKNGVTHKEYSRIYRAANPEKIIHQHAKERAKKKGLDFDIEESDIDIPVICPILGIPIYKIGSEGKPSGPCANSASLDRVDNTKGYVKGNVTIISHKANTMKHNATPLELIRFAEWVLHNYKKELTK